MKIRKLSDWDRFAAKLKAGTMPSVPQIRLGDTDQPTTPKKAVTHIEMTKKPVERA
jgi:hypothetical protein